MSTRFDEPSYVNDASAKPSVDDSVGAKLSLENTAAPGQSQETQASKNLDGAQSTMKAMGILDFSIEGSAEASTREFNSINEIPDSPQGQNFRNLERAFNSGDTKNLIDALKEIDPNLTHNDLREWANLQKNSGGLTFEHASQDSDGNLKITMKESKADGQVELNIKGSEVKWDVADSTNPPQRLTEHEIAKTLPQKLEQDASENRFSGVAAIARVGENTPFVETAVGDALTDATGARIANTPDTQFRIASMGKMFTAMTALKLADEGKLDLNAKISDYLKYSKDYDKLPQSIKDFADNTTARELLTHRSGAGGDIFDDAETGEDKFSRFTFDANDKGQRRYSNMGYEILGKVLEGAVNKELPDGQRKDIHEILHDKIFEPLGMTSTHTKPEGAMKADIASGRVATGYTTDLTTGNQVSNESMLPERGSAAGGGVSSARDMIRFGNELARMANDSRFRDLFRNNDGLGFEMEVDPETRQINRIGHSGGFDGMTGDMSVYPQSGYIATVLSNGDTARQVSQHIENRLPRSRQLR